MKKIICICICICISLVFGCGKSNSVVQRETDVSSVSIPDNQTKTERQDSTNKETNQQNIVDTKQSVPTPESRSWITRTISEYPKATLFTAITAVSAVLIVSVVLLKKNNALHGQVNQLTTKNTELSNNNTELKKQPASAPIPAENAEGKSLKQKITDLSKENEQLKNDNEKIEQLQQERDKAKEDAKLETAKLGKDLSDATSQVETLKQELANSEQTINVVNSQAQQLKEENEQLKNDNEKIKLLEKQVSDLNQQKASLTDKQRELSIVKQEKNEFKAKINKLETSIANLETNFTDLQTQYEALQKIHDDKLNELDIATDGEKAARNHTNELIDENVGLKREKKEIEEQILTLKEVEENLKNQVVDSAKENKQLSSQVETLKQELANLEQTINAVNSQAQQLKEENEQIEQLKQSFDDLKLGKENIERDFQNLKTELVSERVRSDESALGSKITEMRADELLMQEQKRIYELKHSLRKRNRTIQEQTDTIEAQADIIELQAATISELEGINEKFDERHKEDTELITQLKSKKKSKLIKQTDNEQPTLDTPESKKKRKKHHKKPLRVKQRGSSVKEQAQQLPETPSKAKQRSVSLPVGKLSIGLNPLSSFTFN